MPLAELGSREVLIVEDEHVSRRTLARLLESCGYSPRTARSGEEALELLRSNGRVPRVALVDLNLPGMDGLDLVERLAELDPNVTPVLITAASGDVLQDALERHELREVKYLSKPLDFNRLLRVLSEAEGRA